MSGDFSIESGARAAERLLGSRDPPTAIFCFNDEMAMGALGAARRRGLRVPEDLSIVGFDDVRYAAHTNPPLTTIAQPMQQIGEGAVRLLLDLLNGRPDVAALGDDAPPARGSREHGGSLTLTRATNRTVPVSRQRPPGSPSPWLRSRESRARRCS